MQATHPIMSKNEFRHTHARFGDWEKELLARTILLLSGVSKVVIFFFLGSEASNAMLLELLPELLSIFFVDLTTFLRVTDYFLSLFLRIASSDEVYHVGHVAVETPRGCSFFIVFLARPHRVHLNKQAKIRRRNSREQELIARRIC